MGSENVPILPSKRKRYAAAALRAAARREFGDRADPVGCYYHAMLVRLVDAYLFEDVQHCQLRAAALIWPVKQDESAADYADRLVENWRAEVATYNQRLQ